MFSALDNATTGPVAEGNVGGGTGMICHQFKGGIGTASRVLTAAEGGFTVGVLVQCNYGLALWLRVAGVPVGEEIPDLLPCRTAARPANSSGGPPPCDAPRQGADNAGDVGLDHRHRRDRRAAAAASAEARGDARGARRRADGRVRQQLVGRHLSRVLDGEPERGRASPSAPVEMLANARVNGIFQATVQATEEAILNALLAAETMDGGNGVRVSALPHDRLLAAMKKYGEVIVDSAEFEVRRAESVRSAKSCEVRAKFKSSKSASREVRRRLRTHSALAANFAHAHFARDFALRYATPHSARRTRLRTSDSALRTLMSYRHRMPWFVQHHVQVAWENEHHRDAPPFVLRLALDLHALGPQVPNRAVDVVAHERELMANAGRVRGAFGRMHAELRGRQREDQPAFAGIDVLEPEDIAQHRAQRVGLG